MKNWSTTRVSFREFCVVLFFLCFYFEFLFYINTCVNIFLLCLSVRHDMLSSKIYIFTSKREEKSLNYACAVCLIKHRIFVFEQQSDVRTCSGCASVLVRACSDEKKIEFYTLDVLEEEEEIIFRSRCPLSSSHDITRVFFKLISSFEPIKILPWTLTLKTTKSNRSRYMC